jgi:hypothetical protein
MIDWDKPIETSNGYPARLISENFRDCDETLMLVQIEHPERSIARTFKKNGRPYWAYEGTIRNRKTKREGWVNVYSDLTVHGKVWETEEKAKQSALHKTIATAKIEWEE